MSAAPTETDAARVNGALLCRGCYRAPPRPRFAAADYEALLLAAIERAMAERARIYRLSTERAERLVAIRGPRAWTAPS